jgi:hypothetical protein
MMVLEGSAGTRARDRTKLTWLPRPDQPRPASGRRLGAPRRARGMRAFRAPGSFTGHDGDISPNRPKMRKASNNQNLRKIMKRRRQPRDQVTGRAIGRGAGPEAGRLGVARGQRPDDWAWRGARAGRSRLADCRWRGNRGTLNRDRSEC